MAKKIKTIVKSVARQAFKEADYKKNNTDVVKSDNVTYSYYPWKIAPNKSTATKIGGTILNSIGMFFPILNIFIFDKYINLITRKVKFNAISETEHKVRTTTDRRYKSGERVVGSRFVTKYSKNIENLHSMLNEEELKHNKKWFIIMTASFLVLSPTFLDDLTILPWVIIGLLIGGIKSYLESKKINHKIYSQTDEYHLIE